MIVYLLQEHFNDYTDRDERVEVLAVFDNIIDAKYSSGNVGKWHGNNIDGYYTDDTTFGNEHYTYLTHLTITQYTLNARL